MRKIAIIIIGHYRSFDKVHESLLTELKDVSADFYLHTWSTQNSFTPSWHDMIEPAKELTLEQIDLLKKLDPDVEIEAQDFSKEELKDLIGKKPVKAIVYLFQALQKCLKRIKDISIYDYIFVTRYDISYKDLLLDSLKIRPNEICIGWRLGLGFIESLIAHDIIYAFRPIGVSKFIDKDFLSYILENRSLLKIPEEIYALLFRESFKHVSREWEYDVNFEIIR